MAVAHLNSGGGGVGGTACRHRLLKASIKSLETYATLIWNNKPSTNIKTDTTTLVHLY